MNINPIALPTFFFSAIAFCIGAKFEVLVQRKSSRRSFFVVAALAVVPGVLFVLYYVHLFDNAAWFYNLRHSIHRIVGQRYGSVGWICLFADCSRIVRREARDSCSAICPF